VTRTLDYLPPESVTPSQWWSDPHWTREQFLWFEVLIQAIRYLAVNRPHRLRGDGHEERWIRKSTIEPGSFGWICQHLNFDACAVRTAALAGKGKGWHYKGYASGRHLSTTRVLPTKVA